MSQGSIFYPQVTSVPKANEKLETDQGVRRQGGAPSEFDKVFESNVSPSRPEGSEERGTKRLESVVTPLKFSSHASQRLKDRKISFDQATLGKINDAVNRAESKGVEDTLVITPEAALIVNVGNRTVVTALDRKTAGGNVFTNIDGAVIV